MPPNEIVVQQTAPLAAQTSETESLIRVALDKGMNPTELYAILREERAQKAKSAFSAAKAKFQSECPPIDKSATNPQFSVTRNGVAVQSSFAPLETMQAIADKHLHANGFSYDWRDASDTAPVGKIKLLFILTHAGGHSEEYPCTISAPSKGGCSEPQKDGIAYEYARRQSFRNGTGIRIVGEDLDGDTNAATSTEYITDDQKTELVGRCDETGANVPKLMKWAGCTSFDDFPAAKFAGAIDLLKSKPKVR